jgi:hypothetical protein
VLRYHRPAETNLSQVIKNGGLLLVAARLFGFFKDLLFDLFKGALHR